MKQLLKLSLFTLLVVGISFSAEAQKTKPGKHKICDTYAKRAMSYLNTADNCQEVGEGILNQIEKAMEAAEAGDCKNAEKLLNAAQNGLNAKLNKARRDYLKAIADGDYDRCDVIAYRYLIYAQRELARYESCMKKYCEE